MSYRVVPLGPDTWEPFAELVERNNGVYGGCWCIGFHPECGQRIDHRAAKRERVMTDGAHAALVIDEDGLAQGWAQYGDPDELAGIKHKRAYDQDPPPEPDWRITCIYVDRRHRGQGIARLALSGALELIAAAGGGLVEAISETTVGRQAQGRFLFSATAELYEDHDFQRVRQVGKHAWILSRTVAPAHATPATPVHGIPAPSAQAARVHPPKGDAMTTTDLAPWEPPIAAGEAEHLVGMLDRLRATFRWKADGLDVAQLRSGIPSSTLTMDGLLKHLALVEDDVLCWRIAGEQPVTMMRVPEGEDLDTWQFTVGEGETAEEIYALYDEAVARSRTRLAEIVAQGRLDEPAHLQPDGLRPSIRRFVCDLVEEYGRHTGHADLLREAIDGRVGEDPPGDWAWPALRPAL
ncbi:GNAT family N-acetyltransferase [Arsenicicoccus bolidensis]|uniref:GNAT family N-acetyltransferase n=1 Tax=Arsenicicoccus bolidensis TaxID=229480 RepID=A0ABS9Q8V3_9MICO|nr:GNAT family N-acetyltransferase [Arsenicicoccus bolidensis]MCG7323705.1 GNAT family N-acetyltransferase [Arsenicicoccus bolidensis]